jgi:hypothetical protein
LETPFFFHRGRWLFIKIITNFSCFFILIYTCITTLEYTPEYLYCINLTICYNSLDTRGNPITFNKDEWTIIA